MTEWKYLVLHLTSPISENKLKQMGRQCWELAGCATGKDYAGARGRLPITKYVYYFKMPRKLTVS